MKTTIELPNELTEVLATIIEAESFPSVPDFIEWELNHICEGYGYEGMLGDAVEDLDDKIHVARGFKCVDDYTDHAARRQVIMDANTAWRVKRNNEIAQRILLELIRAGVCGDRQVVLETIKKHLK